MPPIARRHGNLPLVFSCAPVLAVALLFSACDDSTNMPDGDVLDAGPPDGDVANSRMPQPAVRPSMLPCRAGWREVDTGDAVLCKPWPESGRADCGPYEAHFPGRAGCEPIGDPCPSGRWSETIAADANVIYVAEGETAGDGSELAPFGTIEEALAVARSGDIVALSAGTYREVANLRNGVTLWGACVERTVIVASPDRGGVINTYGPGNGARNLRLSGVSYAISMGGGSQLEVHGVLSANAAYTGVYVVQGSILTGDELVVRDTAASPTSGNFGRGIEANTGATIDLSSVVLEANHHDGIYAAGAGTRVHLEDISIFGTLEKESDGQAGRALSTEGLSPEDTTTLDVVGGVFEDNRELGVFAIGNSTIRLEDSIIVGTRMARSAEILGRAGLAQEGGVLDFERVWIDDNEEAGLSAVLEGSALRLTDVILSHTIPRHQSDEVGLGMTIDLGAILEAHRVLIVDNYTAGLIINDAVATLEDLVILRTLAERQSGLYGRGLSVSLGAEVQANRVEVRESREVGVLVYLPGSTFEATDLLVADTQAQLVSGRIGRGIHVGQSAQVTIERALFEHNTEASVSVNGLGASLTMTSAIIRHTRERACVDSDCPENGAGLGLIVTHSGSVVLSDFEISESALAAVTLASDGEATLRDGEIFNNVIGINLQVQDYDLNRLTEEVRFMNNETRLDSLSLPLPEVYVPEEASR